MMEPRHSILEGICWSRCLPVSAISMSVSGQQRGSDEPSWKTGQAGYFGMMLL